MKAAKPPSAEQIRAEFDRINQALCSTALSEQQWMCLYAARLAMDWLICNNRHTSPYEAVICGDVAMQSAQHQAMVAVISGVKSG